MRIAFIGQKGMPAMGGGVERYVEDLSLRLVEIGHEVSVYTRPHYTDPQLTAYRGVQLVSLPSVNTKHLDAISHTVVASFHAAFQNYDVIHYQSIGPALVMWLPRLLNSRIRLVATLQSRDYEHQKWGTFAKLALKLGERAMCYFADEIIVVTQAMVTYVKENYDRDAVYVPNGANLYAETGSDLLEQFGLSKNNYIVAISRLVPHKGLAYLIEAYQQLETDKKLVIVGESSYSDEYVYKLKSLAGDNKNIIFTGAQTGEVLAQLYQNTYLFVQPSESEGLSLALLEAMARSRAVLVSDITENLAAVGETGFVFANKNVDDLKHKLVMILANPELVKQKGLEAQNRIIAHFNWEQIAQAIAKLYRETKRKSGWLKQLLAVK